MHQTLFYIPQQIGSFPVFGFGLLLAAWAVFGVGLLLWLGWRQGWTAETASYIPLLALVAAAIWWLLPALCDGGRGLPIRGYGVMLLVAVTSAVALAAWRARRLGLDPDVVFAMAFWMFVPGILGARAFYVIEYWDTFPSLGAMVNVSKGGLVVYGSLVGGAIGLLAFVRKNRLPLLATWDLITPSMLLGLALGRVGCLLNGCCFGGPCHVDWGLEFPAGSPPYVSQVERGQVFGFRISGNRNAEPVVLEVEPEGPAGRAGLRVGDRLESINGQPIESAADAHRALSWAYYRKIRLDLTGAQRKLLLEHVALSEEIRAWLDPNVADSRPVAFTLADWEEIGKSVASAARRAEKDTVRDALSRVAERIEDLVEKERPARSRPVMIRTADGREVAIPAVPIRRRSLKVHPTQVYSSINALLLCLFALAYDPYCRRDGQLFATLISIYPITRFLLEIIRIDESPIWITGLSISQNVSLGIVLLAAALWAIILRRPPGRALFDHR